MRTTPIHAFNYYHIYNRGINQGLIYFAKENYRFFLDRLGKYFSPDKARIISYCLMPSHYHLLVYPLTDDFGNQVMQPFSVSYTKAINKRRERSGPLFEGPYQARLVDEDKYLLHLSRYIHLNPVSAGLVDRAEDWEFSSYKDYIGIRRGGIARPDIIIGFFKDSSGYVDFVMSESEAGVDLPINLRID
jgi:REP element-mobilizing transposase RayT